MFIIIGSDGKEYGPADATTVKDWMARNLANQQTQARRVEESAWKTLGEFPEFAGMPPPLPVTAPTAPLGRVDDPVSINVHAYAEAVIRRGRKISVGDCMRRGWALYTGDFWPLLGVTVLLMGCSIGVGMVPYIGGLINLVMNGIFIGGLLYVYLGKIRGQPRALEDGFIGFKRMTLQLALGGAVPGLLAMLAMLPGLVMLGVGCVLLVTYQAAGILLIVLGGLVGFCMYVYCAIIWYFPLYLIVDRRLAFWDAMEVSRRVVSGQWWRIFWLAFLTGLVVSLGVLACFVGVFFLAPFGIATIAYAYEDLFGGTGAG